MPGREGLFLPSTLSQHPKHDAWKSGAPVSERTRRNLLYGEGWRRVRLLIVLAATLGVLAVLVHMARAAFRALSGSVESFLAREIGQTRARHGDLTGLTEAATVRSAASRRRVRAFAELVGLAALLVFGALSPWTAPIYAALSILWIPMLKQRRRRSR